MLFWCLILNDDKIEQLSAVVPSHKPNFDTFKQSNLSFFCDSSGSKLASLASSLCFRWWPCWELLHDFMDASYFKRVMIYHCILWNSLRKQFCHFQCPKADFVWSAPSFFGGVYGQKRRSWLRWLLIIHLRQRVPTCSNCLHKETKSNIPGLPYPPSTGYSNCILQWRHQKKMEKSSCSQPAQLLQRGHLTIRSNESLW